MLQIGKTFFVESWAVIVLFINLHRVSHVYNVMIIQRLNIVWLFFILRLFSSYITYKYCVFSDSSYLNYFSKSIFLYISNTRYVFAVFLSAVMCLGALWDMFWLWPVWEQVVSVVWCGWSLLTPTPLQAARAGQIQRRSSLV